MDLPVSHGQQLPAGIADERKAVVAVRYVRESADVQLELGELLVARWQDLGEYEQIAQVRHRISLWERVEGLVAAVELPGDHLADEFPSCFLPQVVEHRVRVVVAGQLFREGISRVSGRLPGAVKVSSISIWTMHAGQRPRCSSLPRELQETHRYRRRTPAHSGQSGSPLSVRWKTTESWWHVAQAACALKTALAQEMHMDPSGQWRSARDTIPHRLQGTRMAK